MNAPLWLGLGPSRWLTLATALFALLLSGNAALGHARTNFRRPALQWVPLVVGGALAIAAIGAAIAPLAPFLTALRLAGWLAVAAGLVGTAVHYLYGVHRQPGGAGWWWHHVLHRAPPFAPLGYVAAGLLGAIASVPRDGRVGSTPLPPGVAVLVIVALALIGASLQSGMLHARGAFRAPAMLLPLIVPPAAAAAAIWATVDRRPLAWRVAAVLLWATVLLGFTGVGVHLGGVERHPGGLHRWRDVLREGPPVAAPALFIGIALVGLVAVHLLAPLGLRVTLAGMTP